MGQTLVQLQDTDLLLQAQVQPTMPPEQVAERKNSIEEITTQFGTMEQEVKTVMEATTQFWQSIVQDELLDLLTVQVQGAEGKLTTLKTSLKAMLLMV